ncbi:MAG: hypothetical protein AUI58_02050 [Chloroflexi bacterium 13_1_40CM_2_70_6]|nr:MAG: hypothetical protein AUI58_02050 [Chloroflexi bacterium 13_1_40CM_2_70_6]
MSERRVTFVDLIRAELPGVFAFLDRAPWPAIAPASLPFAVLAAFGAGLFVDAALRVPLGLVFQALGLPVGLARFVFQLVTLLATAAAAAVAWRSGGGDAARVYVAILAIERVLGLPALLRFCAVVQQEFSCGPLAYVLGLWPLLLGLALSVPVRRRLRIVAGDRNPLLEAGGAFVLANDAVVRSYGALAGQATGSEGGLAALLGAVAGGIACGIVIARRAPRHWRTLGLVALAVLGQWVVTSLFPFFAAAADTRTLTFRDPAIVFALAAPAFGVAAAVVILYMAAARQVRDV